MDTKDKACLEIRPLRPGEAVKLGEWSYKPNKWTEFFQKQHIYTAMENIYIGDLVYIDKSTGLVRRAEKGDVKWKNG